MGQIEVFMKAMLKKILFISLFFSVAIPSVMQANLFNWALMIEVTSPLRKHKIKAIGAFTLGIAVAAIVKTVFVWKKLKKKERKERLKKKEAEKEEKRKERLKKEETEKDMKNFQRDAEKNMENLQRDVEISFIKKIEKDLENGANIDEKDQNGDTTLMIAAKYCLPKMVKFLLKRGASVDEQNKDGRTALMIAAHNEKRETRQNCRDIIELLFAVADEQNHRNTIEQIFAADEQNHIGIMKQLFAADADPRVKANDGTTALEQGDSETIRQYMREREREQKQTPGILVNQVENSFSLALPDDLANEISKFAHWSFSKCEPAQ